MKTNILYSGTSKKGTLFTMRFPVKKDVPALLEYINTLSQERTYIRFQGEIVTLQQEKKYVAHEIEAIKNHKGMLLLCFSGDRLIGSSGIKMQDMILRHVGVFAISIAKDFRGEGLGETLMSHCIDLAIQHIPTMEIITLFYHSDNPVAPSLYKKLGFVPFGILPKGIKLENGYADQIEMYKPVV